jgi:chemotaxis protein methyltransferase CheR
VVSGDIDRGTFAALAALIYDRAGIVLRPGKESLVTGRLGKRLTALGLPGWQAYLDHLAGPAGEDELVVLLDAISTNVTSFFREPDHFAHLRAQASADAARGRLRYWCAAASTGEEPYSMAMVLADAAPQADWRILATDISTRVLDHAQRGGYGEQAAAGVPADLRGRWMARRGDVWQVDARLRERVAFARLNLAQPPFPMQGPFDAVFVRNVMIYFDNPVRQRLLDEVVRLLRPGGLLYVGHTESLAGLDLPLRPVAPAVYGKP